MPDNIPLNKEYVEFVKKVDNMECPLCGSTLKPSDKECEHPGGIIFECSSCSFSCDQGID